MIEWKRWREDDPERRKTRPSHWPEPDATRVYERFAPPTLPIVCDVVVEPAEERGDWMARFRYHGSSVKGRAADVDEAKRQALDAADKLLADALDELEYLRTGTRPGQAIEAAE